MRYARICLLAAYVALAVVAPWAAAGVGEGAPASTLVPAESMRAWLERASAHNERMLRVVQQLKQTGDVDSARDALETLWPVACKLADEGEAISARAAAEGMPLHGRKDLHGMLSDYRLKLETQCAELDYLISETAPLQEFPGLTLYICALTVKVEPSEFWHADTRKRLTEYAPMAYALAEKLADCLDRISDADSAAKMTPRYAELRRELAICVGIINHYISCDLEGAQQGGLSARIKKKLAELSQAFEQRLPRLAAAGYYGCEPLRALLEPIMARERCQAR